MARDNAASTDKKTREIHKNDRALASSVEGRFFPADAVGAPSAYEYQYGTLEQKLEGRLHYARVISPCDEPKIAGIKIRDWVLKLRMVEDIEGFKSELEALGLGELRIFQQREV